MQSLRIHGKLDMQLEEISLPELKAHEVRIKVSFVGICGSDLHYYYEGANGAYVVKEPLTPGHELSGVVDMDPQGILQVGTKVTVHPAKFGESKPGLENAKHLRPGGSYLGSASTTPHTQGAMSEYINLDRSMLRVLPESLSLQDAALAEPLAVGLHAINIAGGVKNKKVLVSGSGPIGLLAIAAAKLGGAVEIIATDVLQGPLDRARELGVTGTIRIGADTLPDEYFDVVLECSGAPRAISSAIKSSKRLGVIVQVGMLMAGEHPIDLAPLISKEVQLRGTFRFNDEIDDAILLLEANSWIGKVITHTFEIKNALAGFEVAKNSQESGKVLISL
jgi:L-idonate 5-dehydrogenase